MTMLIAALWQGMAIAAATAILLRLAPRLNASTRYAIWWMALLSVIVLPIAHLFLSSVDAAVPTGALAGAQPAGALVLPAPPDWLIACAAGVWFGAALLGFWKIGFGLHLLSGLKRRARPLDVAVERRLSIWNSPLPRESRAALRVSHEVASACALGLFGTPIIVFSERLVSTLDADALDHIAMHEQAHLSRHDDWTRLLQSCLMALLGLHPAVRFISARIDLEREAACDDAVVARTGAARRYATYLAEAADAAARQSPLAPAILSNATGTGSLLARVQRLLDPRVMRRGHLHATATAAGLVAFTVAAGVGPNAAPLVVVLDAIASLPAVAGEPAHRTVDWRSRATLSVFAPVYEPVILNEPPITEIRVAAPSEPPNRPVILPVADVVVDHVPPVPTEAPAVEPAVLASTTTVPVLLQSTTGEVRAVDEPPGWKAAGEVGAAIGQGVARMGTATGVSTWRASIAVGGFFGRAGKAVADSF